MGVVISFDKDGKPIVEQLDLHKNKIAKAYIDENGKIVVGFLTVYDGCPTCPYHEEHPIGTPDSYDCHCEGVYCSLKKEEHPYPGAATDKKKIFEHDWPSEKKKYKNYVPDWCPLRGREK